MSPAPDANVAEPSDPLLPALRKLTESYGIRSNTLHADLGPELRILFYVPDWDGDTLRTLARVTWQLNRLLTTQLVGEDLQQVARVSYNLGIPTIRDLKLGQRRAWLHQTRRRLSPSESQRDLRSIVVPAFVASLRSEPSARPLDRDIAALMAAESGRPSSDYLPFPTQKLPAPEPPPAEPRPNIRVNVGRLIIIVLSLLVIIFGTAVLSFVERSNGPSGAQPSGNTGTTTRPTAAETVAEVGGNRHGSPTFRDPFHPAESGQAVSFRQEVQVTCKVRAFSVDSIGPDGYWYRIASPPWSNQLYAPAITFLNGDPVDGPYSHNYDQAVPDC